LSVAEGTQNCQALSALLFKYRAEIAAAMYHMHDPHAWFHDTVKNHVWANGKTAVSSAHIIAAPPKVRIFSK
jgi:hypothetical protein